MKKGSVTRRKKTEEQGIKSQQENKQTNKQKTKKQELTFSVQKFVVERKTDRKKERHYIVGKKPTRFLVDVVRQISLNLKVRNIRGN